MKHINTYITEKLKISINKKDKTPITIYATDDDIYAKVHYEIKNMV